MNDTDDDDKAVSPACSTGGEWRGMVMSGVSAIVYGVASLMTVCLNHQVLDTWTFPSSTLILSAQVALTLLVATWTRWSFASGEHKEEEEEASSKLVNVTAPKMAALFVADVALGHGATRWLGLDAFATFRRFGIPFAMHLDESKSSWSVFLAAWSMVLGPLLGLYFGRQSSKNSETDEEDVFFWDATTWQGGVLSIGSALVSAARIVLLRRALTTSKERDSLMRQTTSSTSEVSLSSNHLTPAYNHLPSDGLRARADFLPVVAAADTPSTCPTDRKRRNAACRTAATSNPTDVALALLSRTSALSLPLVLAFGASFDFKGIETALSPSHKYLWLISGDFFSYFVALVTMGPLHEFALYACVYHNTALTTLVAGGFKTTALATYRATISTALGGKQHQLDRWDAISLAISTAASIVYTYAWYTEELLDNNPTPSRLSTKRIQQQSRIKVLADDISADEEERCELLRGEEDDEEEA